MLRELLEYLATPCPPLARRLGYLKEAVAIGARARRCREAWRPHLENCRAVIREAAGRCEERGTALVLGSGSLLDIPVEELAGMFDRVVLADLVHPLAARRRVRKLPNVRLAAVDLSGVLEEVAAGRLPGRRIMNFGECLGMVAPGARPMPENPPRSGRPEEAIRSPGPGRPDLAVSANILSQLPLLPLERLAATGKYRPEELEEFARGLIEDHLAGLSALLGVVCLLTDIAWLDGSDVRDPLRGLPLPEPVRTWTWNIAPRPEVHPDRDVAHRVAAVIRPPRP